MSLQLADTLKDLLLERKKETLRKGRGETPAWVFVSETGTPNTEKRIGVSAMTHYVYGGPNPTKLAYSSAFVGSCAAMRAPTRNLSATRQAVIRGIAADTVSRCPVFFSALRRWPATNTLAAR